MIVTRALDVAHHQAYDGLIKNGSTKCWKHLADPEPAGAFPAEEPAEKDSTGTPA